MPADLSSPLDAFRLDGRVAIITGASSGIGARAAAVLHDAGASVVLAARRTDRIEALAHQMGDRALAVTVDVADDASVDALVARTLDHFGAIDIVVNNAGFGEPAAAENEPREQFRKTIAVNLVGPFVLTQAVAGHMLERGSGSVVNVASTLGFVGAGRVTSASYCASKGGLINLTRELAAQWARRGVRVNALAPGWFETEMTADFFADEGGHAWIRRNTPMGRGGRENELDGALLFLASDASSFVTGQVIVVDGGWTAV
jgi:NAD(P)-dependent dehydrogenase (short-subunit alcohol dehydrogenase family)